MPICRVCKKTIDKKSDDWIMPSRNYYYHKSCYADFKDVKKDKTNEDYKHLIYDYLSRELKVSYEYYKIEAQINQFIKDGMTMKGIFFALKYYYDKMGKEYWLKGYGGIGIVPYIYEESSRYWIQREQEKVGTLEAIVAQIKKLEATPKAEFKATKKKKETHFYFDDILKGEEDDR